MGHGAKGIGLFIFTPLCSFDHPSVSHHFLHCFCFAHYPWNAADAERYDFEEYATKDDAEGSFGPARSGTLFHANTLLYFLYIHTYIHVYLFIYTIPHSYMCWFTYSELSMRSNPPSPPGLTTRLVTSVLVFFFSHLLIVVLSIHLLPLLLSFSSGYRWILYTGIF